MMVIDSAVLGSLTIKNLVFPEWWLLAPLPICVCAARRSNSCCRFHRLMTGTTARRTEATSAG